MYAKVSSFGVSGVGGFPVSVEVNISNGLPAFDIVGLPDTAVKESRERVRAAIKNNGFRFPISRLTVNLAPADRKKVGTVYDLPVLIGILCASGELKKPGEDCAFIGEVSLSGELRPVPGALPMAICAAREGIKALTAILSGSNPQHVIIYGPPGIGKTCAARLVLEAAKKSPGTPFRQDAPFIEIDATCVRFDERAIADPLFGSVHDPIYQGAGSLGVQGIPQPKPGAVTKAHGGVLFLDEIGELHPIQMNKLLKVLEDRRQTHRHDRLDAPRTRPRHGCLHLQRRPHPDRRSQPVGQPHRSAAAALVGPRLERPRRAGADGSPRQTLRQGRRLVLTPRRAFAPARS